MSSIFNNWAIRPNFKNTSSWVEVSPTGINQMRSFCFLADLILWQARLTNS